MADKTFYAEGVYASEVVSQQLSKTTKGNFQIVIQMKILGLVDNADPENYIPMAKQYVRTIYMVITENTKDFIWPALEKMGYEGSTFGPLEPGHPQHHSFVGAQVDVYCQHRVSEKDSNTYENWGISRGDQGVLKEFTQLEPREMRQLDSLFGKANKTKPSKAKRQPVAAGNVEDETQITDDDVPF